MRFKSTTRALRRGHLRWNLKTINLGFEANAITGIISPKTIQIPYLERNTSRNKRNWIPYN